MRLLIILILTTALVYVLLKRDEEKRDALVVEKTGAGERTSFEQLPQYAPRGVDPREHAPITAATSSAKVRVTRLRCVTVRGVVMGSDANGLVVDCNATAPAARNTVDYGMSATGSAGDSKRLAELAIRQRESAAEQAFGALGIMQGGQLTKASWEPKDRVPGVVRLAGYPPVTRGETVHVVAASIGQGLYTAAIDLAPDGPGDWKWLKR